jgi:hypothetical protein
MDSSKEKILGAQNKPNKIELNPIACQQDPIGVHYGLNGFHEHAPREI